MEAGGFDGDGGKPGRAGPEAMSRLTVLAICYHNVGVEEEHLRRFPESLEAYRRSRPAPPCLYLRGRGRERLWERGREIMMYRRVGGREGRRERERVCGCGCGCGCGSGCGRESERDSAVIGGDRAGQRGGGGGGVPGPGEPHHQDPCQVSLGPGGGSGGGGSRGP